MSLKRFKKIKHKKPTRQELGGFSASEFKTFLKVLGHKIPRDFFAQGCISTYRNRRYRWRHWGDVYSNDKTFVVDISCIESEFDRWANSVDDCVTFEDFQNKLAKKKLNKNLNTNLEKKITSNRKVKL